MAVNVRELLNVFVPVPVPASKKKMKQLRVYACVIAVIILFVVRISKSEFYSAMAEMEKLLHSEGEIANSLEKYLEIEENRLAKVKRFKEQYEELYEKAENGVETFLSNPVNAFVLLKRLTEDWEAVNELVEDFEGQTEIYNTSFSYLLPEKVDLNGAADALIRLQKTYLLDTAALANGNVKGAVAATNLTASDCFELGRQAYQKGYYKYAVSWMKEAKRRLEKDELQMTKKVDVLELMASSYFKMENYTAAIILTEQITHLDPYHSSASHNLMYYRIHAANMEYKMKEEGGFNQTEAKEEESTDDIDPKIFKAYEKLCRGESSKTPKENSKLNCYRTANGNSYLLLQPAKVEVVNLNPRIVLFHDVVNDAEMNLIKSLALPKLRRATVTTVITGEKLIANYRVSKSAWMADNEDELILRLNRRIGDLTGLDTKHSENLHVINYGIGGHYEPHADFVMPDEIMNFPGGNRIATWIFYLSHVTAGGSTVFPTIDVEVKPVKGAAVFWYNLYKTGFGDERTIHAACPVLSGSKWVATKWLHEVGNEFKRPCILESMK